jgi:hypothetical protein
MTAKAKTCALLALPAMAVALAWAPRSSPPTQTVVARDIVRIEQFHPFTVPEGRTLVLQSAAYGSRGKQKTVPPAPIVRALINGEPKLFLSPGFALSPGFTVPAGTRVEAEQDGDEVVAYLLGYMIAE